MATRDVKVDREQGEVSFTVDRLVPNPDQPGENIRQPKHYTMKLSMLAARDLEKKIGQPIGQLLQRASALDFTAILSLMFALCQYHHKAEIRTENDAAALIDDAGGAIVFFDTLSALGEINSPPAAIVNQSAAAGEGGRERNPPEAGPGGPSSSPLDESA